MVEYINTPVTRLSGISSKNCLKYNRITNCITEIPQDIKYEFLPNDGGLVIKAGSVYYEPNGKDTDGTFLYIKRTLANDYTIPNDQKNVSYIFGLRKTAAGEIDKYRTKLSLSFAGNEPSSIDSTIWWDTNTNILKRYLTDHWLGGYGLPLMILNYTEMGKNPTINQIFNGFGYIGSTIFALPGVKGLMPNGLNKDGTLRNIEFTIPDILVYGPFNTTSSGDYNVAITPSLSQLYILSNTQYNFTRQKPTGNEWRWYNPETNIWWLYIERTGYDREDPQCLLFNHLILTNGVVAYFEPKTPIILPDYNDLLEIKNRIQLVSALPSNPQSGVLYGIPE